MDYGCGMLSPKFAGIELHISDLLLPLWSVHAEYHDLFMSEDPESFCSHPANVAVPPILNFERASFAR